MKRVESNEQQVTVAIVVPVIKLAGGEKIAADLACELNRKKYQVHLLIINEKKNNVLQDKLDSENIKCHFYGKKEKNALIRKFHQLHWIFKTLDELRADIIHVHLDYYFSWIYALIRKKKIVQTFHSQPYRIKNFWTWNVYRLLYKKNLITSILLTKNQVIEFSKLFCVSQKELLVVPDFIESGAFSYPERNYNINKEIVFTFVARFHPIKNHHMLITAFNELLKTVPKCRLLLVGDGKLLNTEKRYVNDLGIEAKVDFMGEINDIAQIFKITDIGVISSDSESFSLALLEAMAAGLPVVVTDVGGMRDIVEGNGIKVPAGNYKKFADAMKKLALSVELRKQYGKQSLELVKKYELNSVVEEYEKIYTRELGKDK